LSFANENENLKQNQRLLVRIILGAFVVIIMMYSFSISAVRDITLYYPPDLRSGTAAKAGDVPDYQAYVFAQYITQQLNNWEKNGAKDYPTRVSALTFYLTPRYKANLLKDIDERLRQGELQNRVRHFRILPGAAYTEAAVEVRGNSWIVWLDVAIEETISGQPVKNLKLRYPIRVVRYDTNREMNPWQLAIDGNGGLEPQSLDETTKA